MSETNRNLIEIFSFNFYVFVLRDTNQFGHDLNSQLEHKIPFNGMVVPRKYIESTSLLENAYSKLVTTFDIALTLESIINDKQPTDR